MKTKKMVLILGVSFIIPLIASACRNNVLTAVGSTTVLPLMEDLSYDYFYKYPSGSRIAVSGGGSTTGVTFAQKRLASIGMASRYPQNDEYQDHNWKNLATFTIGYDSIAFPVNLKDTGFKVAQGKFLTLTIDQLYKIYIGKITTWNQLAQNQNVNLVQKQGSTKQANILTITRETGSGTSETFYSAFNEVYKNYAGGLDPLDITKLPANHLVATSNGLMLDDVLSTSGTIGYCSAFYLKRGIEKDDGLTSCHINVAEQTPGQPANIIDPLNKTEVYKKGIVSEEDWMPGSYAFWHPLNVIVDTKNSEINKIKSFFQFALSGESKKGQKITNQNYIPITSINNQGQLEYEVFGYKTTNFQNLFKFCFLPDNGKNGKVSMKKNFRNTWH